MKYYAGLLDSDGSIQLAPYKVSDGFKLRFLVTYSQKMENEWILEDLAKEFDIKLSRCVRKDARTGQVSAESKLNISSKKAIRLLEQIGKHLVIKQNLAEFALKVDGRLVNEQELKIFKNVFKELRDSRTPSLKNFPSRQWLAGYVDGDGYIGSSYRNRDGNLEFKCIITTHINDPQGIELVHKYFKGYLTQVDNVARIILPLDKTKAESFITYFNSHLKLKKAQFDFVLDVLRKGKHLKKNGATAESNKAIHETLKKLKKPQRLSEQTPAGEAIV